MDGYNLSIVLPTMISGVAAGVLQTGLFPVRAKLSIVGSASNVLAFERSVLLGMAVLGGALSLLLVITSPIIIDHLTASAPASVRSSLTFAYPFTAALVMLNFVGDTCGYLLAMRNRFAIAAAAPVANGVLGAFLLAAWPDGGLVNLVVSTLLGLTLQVCICLWGLKLVGFTFIGDLPAWNDMKVFFNEMLLLGRWILPGVVVSNIAVSLPSVWVAKYGEGAVSAFSYAYRLHSSALQFLVLACSTAILAHFSDLVAQKEFRRLRNILFKAGIFSFVVGGGGILAVWLLGAACLEYIFSGRFDSFAAARVADHWLLLTVGLPFTMMSNVFAKLWQAQKRPMLISVMASIGLIALIAVFFAADIYLGEFSLSFAISMSGLSIFTVGLFYVGIIRFYGVGYKG